MQRFTRSTVVLAGLAGLGVSSYAAQAPSTDEAAIRRTVQYYFDGSRNADSATMHKGFRADVAHMFFVRDGQPSGTRGFDYPNAPRRLHRAHGHQSEHYRISCYCWAMYLRILKRYLEHGEQVPYAKRLDV
jgi:hypothetical protein